MAILRVMEDTIFIPQAINMKVYDLFELRYLLALAFQLSMSLINKEEQNFLVWTTVFGDFLVLDSTEYAITDGC